MNRQNVVVATPEAPGRKGLDEKTVARPMAQNIVGGPTKELREGHGHIGINGLTHMTGKGNGEIKIHGINPEGRQAERAKGGKPMVPWA